jgi:hypothetical protein
LNSADSGKSYRGTSVSDSQDSSDELDEHSDFDGLPAKKKRKPNPPADRKPSGRQGSKAPARAAKVQINRVPKQSDAQPPAATNSRKRKMNVAEVIDLEGTSPPPSKRQATESTVVEAPIASKPPTVDPTKPATEAMRPTAVPSAQASPRPHHSDPIFWRGRELDRDSENYGYTNGNPVRKKAGASPVQEAPTPSAKEVTALDMVKDLGNLMAAFMQEQKATSGLTKEVESRLRVIQRTHEGQPGELLEKLIGDLHSADAIHADMRKLVHTLVGDRDLANKKRFPEPTDTKNVVKCWTAFRQHIHYSFGFKYPQVPQAKAEDAGYVAACIDHDLAKDVTTPETESPRQLLEDLQPRLQSPYLVQSVIAALLCHWLFSGPESMCHDVYSAKELKLYESLLFSSEYPYNESIFYLLTIRRWPGRCAALRQGQHEDDVRGRKVQRQRVKEEGLQIAGRLGAGFKSNVARCSWVSRGASHRGLRRDCRQVEANTYVSSCTSLRNIH